MKSTSNSENIIKEISPKDDMYAGNIDHYFDVGKSAIECIDNAIQKSGMEKADVKNILDLPCGYGRVMRHLKMYFPQANLTACDLVREGVDYCANKFGATKLYSMEDIRKVKPHEKYNLIWCGSLLTHIDSVQWPSFFDFFSGVLVPGGMLIFTVHGQLPADALRSHKNTYGLESQEKINHIVGEYENTGFGYSSYFHSADYGISLSSQEWVKKFINNYKQLKIISYIENGWDNHQDVVACEMIQD